MRELAQHVDDAPTSVSAARGRVTSAHARKSRSQTRPPTAEIGQSTFDFLIRAASALEGRPVLTDSCSFRLSAAGNVRIHWPPRPDPPKSQIARLLRSARSRTLISAPTKSANFAKEPPWLPCCLKPDRGTRGEGFQIVYTSKAWRASAPRSRAGKLVVQPLLEGKEYRVTLLLDGTYDCARLIGRKGRASRWRSSSAALPLVELHRVLQKLRVPGGGFDLIRTRTQWYLLDCNMAPSLLMHGASRSNVGRLAQAYLRSAIVMAANRSHSRNRARKC